MSFKVLAVSVEGFDSESKLFMAFESTPRPRVTCSKTQGSLRGVLCMKMSFSLIAGLVVTLSSVFASAQSWVSSETSAQITAKLLIRCQGSNPLNILKMKMRAPLRTDSFVIQVRDDQAEIHEFVFQPIYAYVTSPGNPYPNTLFMGADYLNGAQIKAVDMDYSVITSGGGVSTAVVDLDIDLSRVVGEGTLKVRSVDGSEILSLQVTQCEAVL